MDKVQKAIYSSSPIGRAYLEYYECIRGDPFGCTVGMPVEVYEAVYERYGGEIGLYKECIKQGKSWQELLGTSGKWDEIQY